jgi:16S rRNA (uracil1498-N3)-methyltransferase
VRIHRIYCKSVSETNSVFKIDKAQSLHLTKVLRLDVNDEVEVFDGMGSSAICKIIEAKRTLVSLNRISSLNITKPSDKVFSFILPFIKKDNFHFMIQKLCEIGATEFIFYKPDLIDQSIAKKDLSKIYSKSGEVIISACKQCGTNFLPITSFVSSLSDAIKKLDNNFEVYVFDINAISVFNSHDIKSKNFVSITGPESGFSDSEYNHMYEKDFSFKLLSKNILRAETAPLVIASLIQNHFDKI